MCCIGLNTTGKEKDFSYVADAFKHTCTLCPCFVTYHDRDMQLALKPYKRAKEPYTVSEDQCLKGCLIESQVFFLWRDYPKVSLMSV